MRPALLALGFVALLAAAPNAAAASRPARAWISINAGLVGGDVDVPCPADATPGEDCSEGGMFISNAVNFTVAGRMALRLRAMRANEDTDHVPWEFAGMVGPRLGRRWYALAGLGHIIHPDDEYPGDVNGMAWEFVRATPTADGVGFEFSIHGNAFGDATFTGISLGLRFGNLR